MCFEVASSLNLTLDASRVIAPQLKMIFFRNTTKRFSARNWQILELYCAVILLMACLGITTVKASPTIADVIQPFPSAQEYARPRPLKRAPPRYPSRALRDGTVGTVEVSLMVDEAGKPFETAVVRSTSKVFERASLKAIEKYTFSPARVGGKPVIGRYSLVLAFQMEGQNNGVQARTIRILEILKKQATKGPLKGAMKDNTADRIRAVIKDRKSTYCAKANAYLLMLQLATRAKDLDLQIESLQMLQHFDVHVSSDDYDEESDRANCLSPELNLNIDLLLISTYLDQGDLASAISEINLYDLPNTKKRKRELMESVSAKAIRKARSEKRSNDYAIGANGSAFIETMHTKLELSSDEDHLKNAKLRCDAGFKEVSLESDTVIQIPQAYGRCQIQVMGTPNAKFRLRES